MHIGNLRTALYAYLFARQQNGKFILRIEDTDQKRNIPQAIQAIYTSLELAGISYDEGPDVGGNYGPYVQSQRLAVYAKYANILIDNGDAYRCFCGEREENEPSHDRAGFRDPCRFLTQREVKNKIKKRNTFVIRQKIPEVDDTSFADHVYGEISIANKNLDDQILLKSDGYPTYNFANVIDDYLMKITHVIRGVEYLSSTPKYNLLYRSFGWTIPEYIHLPHIIKDDGKKYSKRDGDASFEDLLSRGYLASAIINYLALLGWGPENDQEYFTRDELIRHFCIDRINKSSAVFSISKLDWLNGQHIRSLEPEEFHELVVGFLPDGLQKGKNVLSISKMIQKRTTHLVRIPEMISFLEELPTYQLTLFNHKRSDSTIQSSKEIITDSIAILSGIEHWNNNTLFTTLSLYADQRGCKKGCVMWPIRVALSGLARTPGGATEIAEVLGKEETLKRLRYAKSKLE